MNLKDVAPRSENTSGASGDVVDQSSAIRKELHRVITSPAFAGSKRSQEFLQLIVEHALAGRLDSLRERMIGAEMFGRPIDYDTANDAVVRVKATEVRRKLTQYYAEEASASDVRIELPVGSYTPIFKFETAVETAKPADEIPHGVSSDVQALDPREFDPQTLNTQPPPVAAKRLLLPVSVAAFFILLLAAVAAYIFYGRPHEIRAIVVLPLNNLSKDADQDYFAEGITDELNADLGQISSLRVISKTSAITYKDTKKTLPEIARELNVDAVVEGSVQRDGDKVRITVALIGAKNDRYIWGHDYVHNLTDVLSMQGDVAQSIASEIRAQVTPGEQVRLKRTYSLNPKAQDLYLVGIYVRDSGDPKRAVGYLQQSVDIDPNYAPAQAALANAYGWLGTAGWLSYAEAFQKQKTAALKAIEIDDSLSEGHAELAGALMSLDWDWRLPEHELNRALELNPNSGPSHVAKAFYDLQIGQLPSAVYEVNRNLELDPASSRSVRSAALIYYYSRHYDEALEAMQRASVLDSTPASISFPLGVIYAEKGMYAESIREFKAQAGSPHALGHLGNVFARSGDVASARQTITALETHVKNEGIGRYEIAIVYAGLGDKDHAFEWLENAFAAHDKGMTFLKIDPCLDPLRSDPRLQQLIVRTGLP